MKTKLFFILLFSIIFSTSLYSQSASEKEQAFYDMVDFINCEINSYSLDHSLTGTKERKFFDDYKKKFNCKSKKTNLKEVEKFLKENNFKKNIKLVKEVSKFKEKYSDSLSKKELIYLLVTLTSNNDKINEVLGKKPKIFDKEKSDFISKVQSEAITKYLEIDEQKNETSLAIYLLGIFILLNIAFSVFLFLNYTSMKKQIDITSNTKPSSSFIKKTSTKNQNCEKQINELKEEINKLKAELSEIKSLLRNTNLSKNPKTENNFTQVENHTDLVNENKIETENKFNKFNKFYLSAPSSNGTFDDYYAENEIINGKSIYVFELQGNKNTAKFKFIDDKQIHKRVLNSFESYIQNICESDDAFDPQAKGIRVKKGNEGIAKKEGDIWTVTKKMKINYL